MRVLLIEDDVAIIHTMDLILRAENIQLLTADNGEVGFDLAAAGGMDVVLLDLNLPDVSGHEVLTRLRQANVNTPVLILSGLDGLDDKVRGLASGADDYLTKPFHKDELLARIRTLVRRSADPTERTVQCGDLVVRLEAQRAEVAGKAINLTRKEFEILELLALRVGSTMTKEMILNHLYGGINEPEMKIIDVFVCKLRRKLAHASGGQQYIETIWGRGYCLNPQVVTASEARRMAA